MGFIGWFVLSMAQSNRRGRASRPRPDRSVMGTPQAYQPLYLPLTQTGHFGASPRFPEPALRTG